jgi:hypothetical protein
MLATSLIASDDHGPRRYWSSFGNPEAFTVQQTGIL